MDIENIAYCGFDCSKCKIFINTKENDIKKLKEIKNTLEKINNQKLTLNEIQCRGCKSDQTYRFCERCNIRVCAYKKDVKSCALCDYLKCKYIERAKSYNENIYSNLKKLEKNYNN